MNKLRIASNSINLKNRITAGKVNLGMGGMQCKSANQKTRRKTKLTYVCWAHDATNLFHGVQVGTQTAVHSEDFLVDNGGNRQAIEAIGKSLP